MEEDVTKIYEEYSEELLFCKYFIAEKLKHHAEMGRCGENILKKCLQERFQMLEFVTGFIAWANHQSPQCDIIVCRKNFYRRQLGGDIFLVEPNDCIMGIEVKGNATLSGTKVAQRCAALAILNLRNHGCQCLAIQQNRLVERYAAALGSIISA